MTIYVPVGIVASGKTAACRRWVEENQPAVHIEVNDFRTIFFKKYTYDPQVEKIIWNLMTDAAHTWTEWGYNVALDDAVFFLSNKRRQEFIYVIDGCEDIVWDFMPMPTDEDVAERRGRESRGVPAETWVEVAHGQREELEYD